MSGPERRRQLLETARTVFARQGYRATTADVAAAAGVSEALVVKHFGSKERLFRAAILEPIGELVEWALREGEAAARAPDSSDPAEHLERLVTFGANWAAIVREHRALLLSALRDSVAFPQDAALLHDKVRELLDGLGRMLEPFAGREPFTHFEPRAAVYAGVGALTIGALYADDPAHFARQYFETTLLGLLTPAGRRALGR